MSGCGENGAVGSSWLSNVNEDKGTLSVHKQGRGLLLDEGGKGRIRRGRKRKRSAEKNKGFGSRAIYLIS